MEVYQLAAKTLAQKLDDIFSSEEAMELEYSQHFSHLKFDRTKDANTLLYRILRSVWHKTIGLPSDPNRYDVFNILTILSHELDYNIFTQVWLNFQNFLGIYRADYDSEMQKLQAQWDNTDTSKSSPFDSKSKMIKLASSPEDILYNNLISQSRALKVIQKLTYVTSFRLSPKGKTPAFADSNNLSTIGTGGDLFIRLPTSYHIFFAVWELNERLNMVSQQEDGGFLADGIPYPFYSSSGGDILNDVLFSRRLASDIFNACTNPEKCTVLPRINSVMVVAEHESIDTDSLFKVWSSVYPMVKIVRGFDRTCQLQ